MNEYREDDDVDDLLGDDDEEEEYTESPDMIGVDELLAEKEDSVPSSSKQRSEAEIALYLAMPLADGLDLDDSDDEELKEDAALAEKRKKDLEAKKLHEKLDFPPGINLFPGETNGFKYFTLESLNLEKDFSYTRRGKLKGHGFTDEKIDLIFSDRVEFVRHLMPEAQSVLICDRLDFRAVMNFLFYSLAVCTDRNEYDLMAKAFFDLRKNYGFKWGLQPKHIMCCLLNYGADERAVYNEAFFNKGFAEHLRAVEASGQKLKEKKYKLPVLPFFLDQRRKGRVLYDFKAVSEEKFKFAVGRFIQIVCDFSAGLPMYLEFRYKNNWSDQVLLLYLLLLLGTDKKFIKNYKVKEAIKNGIHYHLDSFSTSQWYWGPLPSGSVGPTNKNGHPEFSENNAVQSMVTLFEMFLPGYNCPKVINWENKKEREAMVSTREGKTDHHLNLMYRLSLFPPSSRGNQVKKHLAFMYLQIMVEIQEVTTVAYVNAIELAELPELCEDKNTFFKIISHKECANYGLLMSIVELYDIIVGHEPLLDFTKETRESIKKLKKYVMDWIGKKFPSCTGINLADPRTAKMMNFRNYLDIVTMRWDTWLTDEV